MTSIGSFTPTYDANGDVTNDDLYTYTWDSNGRPVKIGNEALIYDAMGRMVEQDQSGGTYVQFVYDPPGDKLGVMSNTSTVDHHPFTAHPVILFDKETVLAIVRIWLR